VRARCFPLVPGVAIAIATLGGNAGAAPGSAAGTVYIEAGSHWQFSAVTAPPLAEQMGAMTRFWAQPSETPGAARAAAPRLAGSDMPKGRNEEWRAGRAPLGALDRSGRCSCATPIGDTRTERVALLRARRSFRVSDEVSSLRMLRLRARYNDGIAISINGTEVARRHAAPDADSFAFAKRRRGPEWEIIYIPLRPGLLESGDNELAIEVRPSSGRDAPFFDASLEAAAAPSLIRGPIVGRVKSDSATIVFETDLPTTGLVRYGNAPSQLGRTASSAGGGLAVRHEVQLDGLRPGEPVHYQVVAGPVTAPPQRFFAAPLPGAVLRVAIYGDVRNGHDVHRQLVRAMLQDAPDLILVTGDLVARGSDEGDWQTFFGIVGELLARVPYYPAAGNHDVGRAGAQRRRLNEIFAMWPGPADRPEWGHWHSFDVAGVHFVMLDSNAWRHEPQLAWLDADLRDARARGARAIVASMHDGPWSRGPHGGNQTAVDRYVPVLEAHGVDLLLSGHDHLYQRGQVGSIPYIVSGGGGAPLYSVRCGVPGRPACRREDGMQKVSSEHHYALATFYPTHIELCARRPDGSPLEPCVNLPLR